MRPELKARLDLAAAPDVEPEFHGREALRAHVLAGPHAQRRHRLVGSGARPDEQACEDGVTEDRAHPF